MSERASSACWGCKAAIPPDKRLCDRCYTEATGGQQKSGQDLEALVRRVVKDSLREREVSQDQAPQPDLPGPSTIQPSLWQAGQRSPPPSDSDSESEAPDVGFSYTAVPELVKAVREALDLQEPVTSPPRKKLFKQLSRERVNFPFPPELKEIFTEEWSKTERRGSLASKAQKLYPFKAEDVKDLESAPLVDAALMRLVKYVTLPLEDTVSFKDPLERRIDQDLKKVYLSAGLAAKPAVAMATVSKAMETWSDSVEVTLANLSIDEAKISPIKELRMASAFLGEVSLDLIRLIARVMLNAVTAKRALWLRPWRADTSSKQAWCRIPFEGGSLFGEKLEEAIKRATGGKSSFLPQDWRQQDRRRPPPPRGRGSDRAKEARSYKPGRSFWRNQKAGRSTSQKGPRGGQESKKSF